MAADEGVSGDEPERFQERSQRRIERKFKRSVERLFTKSFLEGIKDLDAGPERRHVVVFLHGIRDNGEGFSATVNALKREIENTHEEARVDLEPLQYDRIGILRAIFLLMTGKYPNAAKTTANNIKNIYSMTGVTRVSIVAHSFGTYIVTKILENDDQIKFHHIITCGSVADPNFPWGKYTNRFSSIVNDCGKADWVVRLAGLLKWLGPIGRFGISGTHGFNVWPARNRWHSGIRHGDFFKKRFNIRYWSQILIHNIVEWPADTSSVMPEEMKRPGKNDHND